ncbi:hypothetical protein [Ralstonia pickettii]|uniref:Uncharacterized protein n=1 Tax=Ralstonia pickettii TaxID=329 RepID=A0AAW4Q6C6_RALPI|nr:hypothetical protein [Ralstonia pickettii]MBA9846587.1 hypothetical protein [Ralstonia pickettii]MBA9851918.1 hypothetical protein [Ralstonia pickettii]MBA9919725.1 hypothetical protein [Ralstonia pickettii]MBA9958871.1 hypothetical protein [Ralstonia pickettii]MBA9965060.1 hypothetical protein [Ralstonia pickettii]
MTQTIGSQIFGPLYDVVGWVFATGLFVYFGLGAQGLPLEHRKNLPGWMLNKKICFPLAVLSTVFAVGKFAQWF